MSALSECAPALVRSADGGLSRERLDRIRRAARLVASGTLSPVQARHLGQEIERLAGMLMAQPGAGAPAAAAGVAPPAADPRLQRLSTRERQVLAALAAGQTVQEVAHRFCRSPKTINNQRTNVLRKLGLRNTAELIRFAIQSGLVTL